MQDSILYFWVRSGEEAWNFVACWRRGPVGVKDDLFSVSRGFHAKVYPKSNMINVWTNMQKEKNECN